MLTCDHAAIDSLAPHLSARFGKDLGIQGKVVLSWQGRCTLRHSFLDPIQQAQPDYGDCSISAQTTLPPEFSDRYEPQSELRLSTSSSPRPSSASSSAS